jgi:hypothetical protein
MESGDLEKYVRKALERAVAIQQSTVQEYISRTRRRNPEASPEEILAALELKYFTSVTMAGGSVGGIAAAGITVPVALAASVAEVGVFAELTALYTLAVAEIYGEPVDAIERRMTILMTVLIGESAVTVVEKAAGRTGKYWGKTIVNKIPMSSIKSINKLLGPRFVTKFGTKQGVLVLGRAIPFGIGALIGGTANAFIANGVIRAVNSAYGPAPDEWPTVLEIDETFLPDDDVDEIEGEE